MDNLEQTKQILFVVTTFIEVQRKVLVGTKQGKVIDFTFILNCSCFLFLYPFLFLFTRIDVYGLEPYLNLHFSATLSRIPTLS